MIGVTTTRRASGKRAARTPAGTPARTAQKAANRASSTVADIRMSVLLLVALMISITGLHTVLGEPSWWFSAFGVAFVVFAVAAVVRFYVQRRWVPPVAALVAGIVVMTLFLASGNAFLGFIPTADTVAKFQSLIAAGNLSIERQSIPAIATPGINFLICSAVVGMALFMDAMANWARLPVLVGIPLVIVVAIPSFIANQRDPLTFLSTAAVFLLIILFGRRRRPQLAVALVAGVIAALGVLVAPTVLPSVTPAGTNGSGFGLVSENINPIINLGADLRQNGSTPVLSYTTTGETGEYLQLTTLDSFEGEEWAPDTPVLNPDNTVKKVGSAPGLTKGVGADKITTTISIDNAQSTWLPVPYPAKSISGLTGTWLWDASSLAIRSTNASSVDQKYTVTSLDVEPTIQQLEAAPRDSTSPLAKVPFGLSPIVAATAKKVVGNAKTDFDKAVALQNWFRDGTFKYSTKAPVAKGYDGTGIDIIVPFLKAKEGYCVHFATTMAVMARTLGIPSRVAVGFLPGEVTHPGHSAADVYAVQGSDMHAWPELYFKGIGWVRFEPTPSKGFEPTFPNAVGVSGSSGPTGTATGTPTAAPTTTPKRAPAPSETTAPSQLTPGGISSGPTATASGFGDLGILLVVLIIALPAIIRIGIRRRRFEQIRQGVNSHEQGWQELRDTARDLGLDAGPTHTPKQFADSLSSRLEPPAQQSLDRLLGLMEAESYGVPERGRFVDQAMADDIAIQLEIVLHALRRAASRGTRFVAFVAAPSLLDRLRDRRVAEPSTAVAE